MPASRYVAEPLLQTFGPVWLESDLRADPVQIYSDMIKSPDEARKKATAEPISVAVTVSEPAPMDPADPHASLRSGSQKPRLVVFGDASFASNVFVSDRSASMGFDLFASSLDWLRDRPGSIGIEPKKRNFYVISPAASLFKMIVLPGLIAAIAIVGLGTGVWVVRRR